MIKETFLYSEELGREIEVRIKECKESSIYLYFFDAQNIFDESTSAYNKSWHVDRVLDELNIKATIVGITSLEQMERVREYLPGQKGDMTGEFLVKTVIPFAEKENPASLRIIAGSSMGGVMSLYMGGTYPDIFKGVLAMSTAAFDAEGLGKIASLYSKDNDQKVYLDVGTKETERPSQNRTYVLANRMLKGFLTEHTNLYYVEEQGGVHDEISWNRRLPEALKFLLDI